MPIVYHPIAGRVDVPDNITDTADINNYIVKEYAKTIGDQGSLNVFGSQFGEGFASTLQGLAQMFDTGDADSLIKLNKDYFDEFDKRVELETNPIAGYAGLLTGSIADPVVLPSALLAPVPVALGVTGLIGQSAIKGAAAGGVYGFVAPTFEEFGDSQLFNTVAGVGFGGALGAIGGVIGRRLGVMSESEIDILIAKLETERTKAATDQEARAAEELLRQAEEEKAMRSSEAQRMADEERPLNEKEARRYAEEDVRAELLAKAGEELEPKQAAQLVNEQATVIQRLADAEKAYDNASRLAAGGTKASRKRQSVVLDDMKNTVDDLKATSKRLEQQLAKHNEAVEARKEMARLSVGKPSAKYKQRIEADVKANRAAKAAKKKGDDKAEVIVAKAAPDDAKLEPAQAPSEPRLETPQRPQRPVTQAIQNQINAPESEIPLGLEARGTSTGAMEVAPESRFAPEATEGQDLPKMMKAVTTSRPVEKAEAEGLAPRDIDAEATPQQAARRVLVDKAAELQRKSLSGDPEFGGRYTAAEIKRLADNLSAKIGDDYDSLIDYLMDRAEQMKTDGRFLNAAEIYMLQPLIKAAEDGVMKSMKELRSLRLKGELYSEQGLRAVERFQLYAYISQIDLANKAAASAAMRSYKVIKGHRKNIDASVKTNRPVNNIFVGKC